MDRIQRRGEREKGEEEKFGTDRLEGRKRVAEKPHEAAAQRGLCLYICPAHGAGGAVFGEEIASAGRDAISNIRTGQPRGKPDQMSAVVQ